jgi:quercetin dioxygenase-like cupin family protein
MTMTRRTLLVAATLPFLFVARAHAQTPAETLADPGPDRHLTYRAADVEWRDGPGSFEPGSEFAILEGNPAEAGVFTMRIRMPDGFRIAPHWHPNVERVTVVSGTFHLGSGETLDAGATTPLGPGSYTSMPPGMRHYAIAEGETVIQLTSVGPWIINYVNPDDDPRSRD